MADVRALSLVALADELLAATSDLQRLLQLARAELAFCRIRFKAPYAVPSLAYVPLTLVPTAGVSLSNASCTLAAISPRGSESLSKMGEQPAQSVLRRRRPAVDAGESGADKAEEDTATASEPEDPLIWLGHNAAPGSAVVQTAFRRALAAAARAAGLRLQLSRLASDGRNPSPAAS